MIPQLGEAGFQSIGQATARAIVHRAAANRRLGRTLLVHGAAGSGKGAFLDDLLALLLCHAEAPGQRPCNACRSCREARAHTHPDLVMASPESWRDGRSAGESQVAAARRWLLETSGAPIAGPRRVVVIEHADAANEQIQNALLKTLEEPGPRHLFVLVADDPARLLPTIRSRSQPLRIGPVPRAQLVSWLVEEERLPLDQATVVARVSGGLIGRATSYVRNPELVAWRRRLQGELLDLVTRGRADRFQSIPELLEEAGRPAGPATLPTVGESEDGGTVRAPASVQREAALRITDAWQDLARDLMVAAARQPMLAGSAELHPELLTVAERIGSRPMARFLGVLQEIQDAIETNAAPRLALEVGMLAWPHLGNAG
ncbi:MAG: hypothetical protein DLM71_08030 [Chloroflexi bacterium]|nr:MAG: hypothetical protein DLM71_08030 [Chloroflexota bacterium]